MPAEAQDVYFWGDEPVYIPPARRSGKILFTNLVSATLTVDINLSNARLDKISLNDSPLVGSKGSDGAHRSYDVTRLVRSGSNEIKLDYTVLFGIGGQIAPVGNVTAYIRYQADKVTVKDDPTKKADTPPTIVDQAGSALKSAKDALSGVGIALILIAAVIVIIVVYFKRIPIPKVK